MALELDPEQPPAIARLVGALVEAGHGEPDPWWQAGIDEALASDADQAGVAVRNSLGAARA
ncbi:MAG TPA: hypothetical protein VLK36_03955 [Gaiellaceae bacterium]|nr:hypothetical protein [Gaiellaceae bacterium]